MEIEVGIAVYSMMITVLTFLLGFVLVFGGRVVVEMSSVIGLAQGSGVEKVRKWVKEGKRYLKMLQVMIVVTVVVVIVIVAAMVVGLSEVGEEGWEELPRYMWLAFGIGVSTMVVSVISDLRVSGVMVELRAVLTGRA